MGKFRYTSSLVHLKGYTLLNLITTVSIIAILLGIAAPSLANIINNGRISATSLDLFTTLALSRTHALNTGKTVIVCHAKDHTMTACDDSYKANTNWSNGVISYTDTNRNNDLDENDHILTTIQLDSKVAVVFNQNGRLRFFANGSARSAGFYLCSKASELNRHLIILYTGRTRTVDQMNETQLDTCRSKTT